MDANVSNSALGSSTERLQKSLSDIEEAKRNLDHEVGTLISPDGMVLKVYDGAEHSVGVPASDQQMFEGNIFTHNHPGGRTFTLEDIIQFTEDKLREVRVSTPQGTFFSLREGFGEINRTISAVMKEEKVGSYTQAMKTLQDQIEAQSLNLTGSEYQNLLFDAIADGVDKWLTENAAEFGYVYSKGVVKT